MGRPRIEHKLDTNEFHVYHNKYGKYDKENTRYVDIENDHTFSLAKRKDNNKLLGVKLKDFWDTNSSSYKGLKAEEEFKTLLIKRNIPCLYVGQGANYSERNPQLKYCNEEIRIKRPDFLVSFPELGNVLIDVKFRKKWPFQNSSNRVFYIHYNDIDDLAELRNYLNTPVWLAFKSADEESTSFQICPIKILAEIKKKLFDDCVNLKNEKKRTTHHLRVPNEILTEFSLNALFKSLSDYNMKQHVADMIKLETDISIDKTFYVFEELRKKR